MERNRAIEILLVEDNPDDVEITRRALRQSWVAANLHVVTDGQEALDFLLHLGAYRKHRPRPDLILLDVKLPKINGIEVLERISGDPRLSRIPVVMLTASDREEDAVKSYALGAKSFIQKPVQYQRFTEALEVFGKYWSVVAKLPAAA